MIDISHFKKFMESLSAMGRLDFEIRTPDGPLFTCGSHVEKGIETRDIEIFSEKILKEQTFFSAGDKGRYAMFGVPIMNGDGLAASLIARHADPEKAVGGHMEGLLTQMAAIIEDRWRSEKELEKMSEEMSRSFEDMYLYSRIGAEIRTLKFTGDILEELIEDLLETMRTDLAFSRLPEREEYNAAASNADRFPDDALREAFIARLLGAIPETGPASEESFFLVDDSRADAGFAAMHPDPFRFLAVKMQHNGILYGWLGMVSFNMKEIFRRSELSLLGWMAEQMAVVIANTDLYRDLERFVVNVVKSLVHAIEAKDVYTRGHSERVNTYCMMMARHLDLPEREQNDLHWASILHDVGKIGIPESILNKPGRLTDEEYGIIKGHPKKGYDILRPIEQLATSLPGILHHHERIDGNGYPDGLKGDDVPFMAQIIAVADTFDAITSNRAYRDAKAAEKAISIMVEVAGTQLNAHLVDIFRTAYE
ncbi:MAG: HD domain-containing protein, partial [Deltaproteobacteria bacterium]|nr:HD domain-containing protein [Deltaproteobacteria bacterium]